MKVDILGTGSKGNAILVDAGEGSLLIDCGFGPRSLDKRMRACHAHPEKVALTIITHEHSDHISGLEAVHRRWPSPVVATGGTARAIARIPGIHPQRIRVGRPIQTSGFTVEPLPTAHDAAESIGLVITSVQSGARLGIVYDLGHWSPAIAARLKRLDALVLEANYDLGMLRNGPYPPCVQDRIAGSHGHLSNDDAGALARSVAHRGLRTIALAHLSEENNTPAAALRTVREALTGTAFRGTLVAAQQENPLSFTVGSGKQPQQLTLAL